MCLVHASFVLQRKSTIRTSIATTTYEDETPAFHQLLCISEPLFRRAQSAEAKFKEISEAYAVLSDQVQRRTYDLSQPWAGTGGGGPTSGNGFGAYAGPTSATDDERIREWAAKMGYTVNTSQAEFYQNYEKRPEHSAQVRHWRGASVAAFAVPRPFMPPPTLAV